MLKARATPNTVIISIQLRVGDNPQIIECAKQLENEYNSTGIAVQYVLMNSDAAIQSRYKELYGDRIILPSWRPQSIVDFHKGHSLLKKISSPYMILLLLFRSGRFHKQLLERQESKRQPRPGQGHLHQLARGRAYHRVLRPGHYDRGTEAPQGHSHLPSGHQQRHGTQGLQGGLP